MKKSLLLKAVLACQRLFQQTHRPDAVAAALHTAMFAFPQLVNRDGFSTAGAFSVLAGFIFRNGPGRYTAIYRGLITGKWGIPVRTECIFQPESDLKELTEHPPDQASNEEKSYPGQGGAGRVRTNCGGVDK